VYVHGKHRPDSCRTVCGLSEETRCDGDTARCQRMAENGLRVCRACHKRVYRELAELPGLYLRCESLLAHFPQTFVPKVAGGAATGLVLDEAVVNARRDIVGLLASWSGLVADERKVGRPRRRDVTELSAFLAIHVDWLLAHQAGASFAQELVTVAATARAASRGGATLEIELGPCVEAGCEHVMIARRAEGATSSSVDVSCAAGHVWRTHQWLQLAHQVRAR
jgi:hypothetical protein